MRSRSHLRLGALAAAVALAVLAGLGGSVAPSAARGTAALPDCRYDDIMTTPRGYDDWATTLVDTILRLPKTYVPPDLVSVAKAGIAGHGKVRAFLIDDLAAMTEAAAAANAAIGVESAYRSYQDQVATFDSWVTKLGYPGALRVSARPGHSEHQLGLAIDFRSEPGGSPFTGSWAATPAGKWMSGHAWEYGFIRSYPAHKQGITCYASEAWHYRYVGRDLAAAIHASHLTTREYLWANYTTAVVPPITPGPSTSLEPGAGSTGDPGGSPSSEPSLAEPSSSEPGMGVSVPPAGSIPDETQPGSSPGVQLTTPSSAGDTQGSPAPIEAAPVADLDPAVAAGVGFALLVVTVVTVMVLRRGRPRVGL
jgi:zinc D-Ala-D-Ala carboxypeptidase